MRKFRIIASIFAILILTACMFEYCYFLYNGGSKYINIGGLAVTSAVWALWIANLCKILREKSNH